MNAHGFTELLQRMSSVFLTPPPPSFLAGLAFGLVLGMMLASVVFGVRSVAAGAARLLVRAITLVPPVLACLLWGAWIGILAAKSAVH